MGNSTKVVESELLVLRNSSSRPKDDEDEDEDTIGKLDEDEDACPIRCAEFTEFVIFDVIVVGS